jgi:hypothetical protein
VPAATQVAAGRERELGGGRSSSEHLEGRHSIARNAFNVAFELFRLQPFTFLSGGSQAIYSRFAVPRDLWSSPVG